MVLAETMKGAKPCKTAADDDKVIDFAGVVDSARIGEGTVADPVAGLDRLPGGAVRPGIVADPPGAVPHRGLGAARRCRGGAWCVKQGGARTDQAIVEEIPAGDARVEVGFRLHGVIRSDLRGWVAKQ